MLHFTAPRSILHETGNSTETHSGHIKAQQPLDKCFPQLIP